MLSLSHVGDVNIDHFQKFPMKRNLNHRYFLIVELLQLSKIGKKKEFDCYEYRGMKLRYIRGP